jgi:hypothetical protein
VLAEDVANGKTYTLYPGLFTPIIWVMLVSIGLLYLVSENVILKHVAILIVFLWPMIIVLNFFIYGYVVGDQPRLEFALGSLIISGKMTLKQASKISGYFNWPSTWLLEGMFSNVVGLSPFSAPVYLMVVTYLLLGLALIVISHKIFPVHSLAIVSLLAYAVLNPYKLVHFCPQVYSLVLFGLLLMLLLKENLLSEDYVLMFILSTSIITSHPLTSLVIAGIAGSTMFFSLVKREGKSRNVLAFSIATLVLFVSWNINYENLIRSVITEILERPQVQLLLPVAETNIYKVDTFFKLMVFYRYLSLAILSACSLLAVVILLKRKVSLKMRLLAIGIGSFTGIVLLNFIPGSFFHRVLYFACTFMSALIPIAILSVKERLQVNRFIKIAFMLASLLLPLLSHIALLEFLTNNNPVATITSPYEISPAIFIATRYYPREYIGIPSGALAFYIYMSNLNITSPLNIYLLGRIFLISIKPLDYYSASVFAKSAYMGNIFIVSPRERFVYYIYTLFNNFQLVDLYLVTNYNLIYDNGIFKIYSVIKQ